MNEASNIGQWVMAASSVGTLLVVMLKLSGRSEKREITPSPLIIKPQTEYSPKDHIHPQYITREDCREAHQQASRLESTKLEAIQRQLDHLGNTVTNTLNQHNQQAEERANKLHARIDPISQIAQATSSRFDDHIEDHRAGRFSNAN
jgi:hypothetical protein